MTSVNVFLDVFALCLVSDIGTGLLKTQDQKITDRIRVLR